MPRRRIANPMFPLNEIISEFHEQTLMQIDANLVTQRVWPVEVYPGYRIKNEANKRQGLLHSTGQGVRSFRGSVVNADVAGNVTLEYTFNDYMRYVDLGVGSGTSAENVERSKNLRYKSRYISSWDRSEGRSHRPAVMGEFRHLQRRIRDYLVDFYGYEGMVDVINAFDGMNITVI